MAIHLYSLATRILGELCDALPDSNGELACDFQVPVGYTIELALSGFGTEALTSEDCAEIVFPDDGAPAICKAPVTGPLSITYVGLPQ